MSLRMERQQANAQKLAAFLAAHPLVTKVNYPVRVAINPILPGESAAPCDRPRRLNVLLTGVKRWVQAGQA